MIDYIGDVSRRDAELLRALAERSDRILEFGCGASTQILAAYGRGGVTSVDTETAWIDKTQRNLVALNSKYPGTFKHAVGFHLYEVFRPSWEFDLIFVDGLGALRLPFAIKTWPALAPDGVMAFHDTRRPADVAKVCDFIRLHSTEIDRIVMNAADSNITVIYKRVPLLLEDYNAIEGRTPAQLGLA